jgi:hypothetical protein
VRLDQLRSIVCVGCGRGDVTLLKLPDSLWPNARACAPCLARYGAAALAQSADETLAGATPARVTRALPGGGKCLHCGNPTVAGADGLATAWCTSCEAERRRLVG